MSESSKSHDRTRPRSLWWEEHGPLALDFEGQVWLKARLDLDPDDDHRRLGHVCAHPEVPEDCEADLEWLRDEWRGAPTRAELHAEWRGYYSAGLL